MKVRSVETYEAVQFVNGRVLPEGVQVLELKAGDFEYLLKTNLGTKSFIKHGDWVVTDLNNHRQVIDEETFRKFYEPVPHNE